jgi:hypothetical protein
MGGVIGLYQPPPKEPPPEFEPGAREDEEIAPPSALPSDEIGSVIFV